MITALRPLCRFVVAGFALAAMMACVGDGGAVQITGTSGARSGSTDDGGTTASALVGRWSHQEIFDALGQTHSSETIWDFAGNGTATRTVIATNLTGGIADAVVAHARWALQGSSIVITFLSPDSGTVIFRVRIVGSTLTLDGRDFRRTGF